MHSGEMPPVEFATYVTPSDTSTSVVLDVASAPQVTLGAVPLATNVDLEYAPGLKMDLLAPASGGPHPVVVYIPGGGFVFASKEAALTRRTYVAEAGFAVASIEYRALSIAPTATVIDAIADVRAAIGFLRTNAENYSLDTQNVSLWGESAGGYLASMTGLTTADIQAVVNQFGASDLARLADDFDAASQARHASPDNPIAAYVGGPGVSLHDQADAVAKANPVTYVGENSPTHLFFHGSDDRMVSPSQTLLLHQALRGAGAESVRYVVRDADHGDMPFLPDPASALPWTTTTVMNTIVDFLRNHLQDNQRS